MAVAITIKFIEKHGYLAGHLVGLADIAPEKGGGKSGAIFPSLRGIAARRSVWSLLPVGG
jgi:hypothetical protein